MDISDKEFQEKFKNSLGNPALEIGTDLTEIGLDTLVTNTAGITQSIPIAGWFVAVGKMGMAVRDYRFAKKLIAFLNEYNSGNSDRDKLQKFKNHFDEDIKYRSKTIETVCTIVDRLFDEEKSRINARLFRAYVNGSFDWNHYKSLSMSLEQLNPSGYEGLREVYMSVHKNNKGENKKHTKAFSINTSAADYEATLIGAGLAVRNWAQLSLNKYGIALFEFGFQNIRDVKT